MTKRFLGISGSIRPNASSSLVLAHIGQLLPGQLTVFTGLVAIPAFDGSEVLPETVRAFVQLIDDADYVVICSPEYAHGVSGALKNALDWTVATNVWTDKPVALVTAALQGTHAHASLIEILSTMSASVQPATSLLIPFIKSKMNAAGMLTDATTLEALRGVVNQLLT